VNLHIGLTFPSDVSPIFASKRRLANRLTFKEPSSSTAVTSQHHRINSKHHPTPRPIFQPPSPPTKTFHIDTTHSQPSHITSNPSSNHHHLLQRPSISIPLTLNPPTPPQTPNTQPNQLSSKKRTNHSPPNPISKTKTRHPPNHFPSPKNAPHHRPPHQHHPLRHRLRRPRSLRHLSSRLRRGRHCMLRCRGRCLGSDCWAWSAAGDFGV